jgi:hypothetical protein
MPTSSEQRTIFEEPNLHQIQIKQTADHVVHAEGLAVVIELFRERFLSGATVAEALIIRTEIELTHGYRPADSDDSIRVRLRRFEVVSTCSEREIIEPRAQIHRSTRTFSLHTLGRPGAVPNALIATLTGETIRIDR